MKSFIVLLVATIALTCADPLGSLAALGGLTNTLGGGALGLGGGTNAISAANGKTGSLLGLADGKGTVVPLGSMLGLAAVGCLTQCPTTVADTDLLCISSSTFPTAPFCYTTNTDGVDLWPCNPKKAKKTKKATKPKTVEETDDS